MLSLVRGSIAMCSTEIGGSTFSEVGGGDFKTNRISNGDTYINKP